MGTVTEQVKINDNTEQVTAKGTYTVELFDASGNQVDVRKKHNFISQRNLDLISKIAPYGPFGNPTPEAITKIAMDGIVLTDNEKPLRPLVDRYVEGITVGFGVKGYNGVGGLRGTFNSVESVDYTYYKKYVYDFATSEANGTFQSIYGGNVEYQKGTMSHKAAHEGALPFNFKAAVVHKGKIYILDESGGKKLYVFDFPLYMSPITSQSIPMDKNSYNAYDLPFSCRSFTFKGDTIYFAEYGSGSSRNIYTASINSPDKVTKLKVLPIKSDWASGNYYTYWIGYYPEKDLFYAQFNTEYETLLYYDSSWNLLGAIKVPTMGSIPSSTDFSRYHAGLIPANRETIDVDRLISIPTNGSIVEFNDDYTNYVPNNNNTTLSLCQPNQFFSRTLLDSPVTKTSQNTMKITYELEIPHFKVER